MGDCAQLALIIAKTGIFWQERFFVIPSANWRRRICLWLLKNKLICHSGLRTEIQNLKEKKRARYGLSYV